MKQSEEILKAQDQMIDELFDNLKELGHQKLREAYESGAIDTKEYSDIQSYVLPKLIVTIISESGQYMPFHNSYKKRAKKPQKIHLTFLECLNARP
jgi:hypothetical protein